MATPLSEQRNGAAVLRRAADERGWTVRFANPAFAQRMGSREAVHDEPLHTAWPQHAAPLALAADTVLRLGVTREWSLMDPMVRFTVIPWMDQEVLVVEEQYDGHIDTLSAHLLDSAPDAMVIVDEEGIIVLANVQTERIFGHARAEIIGRSVELLVPRSLGEAHRHHRAKYAEDPRVRMMGHGLELLGRRKDGTAFPVEISLSPLHTVHGLRVCAAVRDITERKQAERLFRDLLESAPDAMVILDADGVIKLVNAQTEKCFGYARADLIGRPVEMLIPVRYRAAHQGHRAGFFAKPHTRMMGSGLELHGSHADGHEFPVEISLSPLQTMDGLLVSAAIRDITSRKRSEMEVRELNRTLELRVNERTAQLLRSEERFHEALDGMMEGVQVLDHEWRYTYVNDAVVQQSTYSREQLMGHTMLELYPGIEHTPMFATLLQCRRDGQARVMENVFRFPNGTEGVFELSIRPTHDRLFILSTDITARKEAEREVLAQSARLQRQNAELEQFAYIASHDLQEPLRMVASYVELLERRYGDRLDQDAKEFIGFAVDGTKRMKRLIQDLLMFSRIGRTMDDQEVDLNTVLSDVQHDLQQRIAEQRARIVIGELPVVRGPRTGLFQVFQNLLSNAIKFKRPGVPPEVHITTADAGGQWRITVQDNGIGIDMRYAEQVFIPFKRLHSAAEYPGTGIGLAVAKKVIDQLGGSIELASALGEGTTFTLILPKHGTHATHRDPPGGGQPR